MESHVEILHTVAEAVSLSLDVDVVLRTAVDALTRVTGHEISSLHLLAPDGASLQLRGDRGLSPELRAVNQTLPVGKGVIGQVAQTGRKIHIGNMADDPVLLAAAKPAVLAAGIRAFVCVPIVSRGRVHGTLSLGRRTADRFTDREITLVAATAGQIGIALDNARLYGELRHRLEELERAQAQLVQAEKLAAVGTLAAGIAHEVNSPLTVIGARAELALMRRDLPDDVAATLRLIADETTRAGGIVKKLLGFARQDTPDRRPALLADQVELVLELVGYQLRQAHVKVETDFQPCPPVWIDENQIKQVLLNLVRNAQQAMAQRPEPRVLKLAVRARDGVAAVEVLDNGPGIPEDVLPRIFDPFFTTKPEGEGTGLGLSVSYGIIAEHGGRLSAGNRSEGGAAFVVELPSAKPNAEAAQPIRHCA